MKLFKVIILLFIYFNTPLKANSNDGLQNVLMEGGNLIFIRHAYAPGSGDPEDFEIDDCLSQRNLNQIGKVQSKNIGLFFKKNKIKLDTILSSEWCRCKDTAKFAFQNYKTFNALNSFYDIRFADNKDRQIDNLKKFIKNWDNKKNLVLVTHFVVISEILNFSTTSGEIVISDKNFNIIGNINIKKYNKQ